MQAEAVNTILLGIGDPEIPTVSIVDLGMVANIAASAERIEVELMPTFVGCSAQRMIQERVEQALKCAFPESAVSVRFDLEVPWSTDRITEAGRTALQKAGIAPPGESLLEVACPFCGSAEAVLENVFGATSCRSLFYCGRCKNPFEAFKPL